MSVLLADRFQGTSPLYWDDVEADRRQRLLALLSVEGEVSHAWSGLGPDDELVLVEENEALS